MDLEEVKMEEKETVEDVILSYFKQKRNENLPFIDHSIYDILIKNILSRKEDVLKICSCDDDLKDVLKTKFRIKNINGEDKSNLRRKYRLIC